jgi:hypothetical protein
MAVVLGADKVVKALWAKADKARKDWAARLQVGYAAPYALFVHEDMQAVHPVGQAKFLEQPARTMRRQLADLLAARLRTGTVRQALGEVGEALLAASLPLVPVKSGRLKESGFSEVV